MEPTVPALAEVPTGSKVVGVPRDVHEDSPEKVFKRLVNLLDD